MADIKCIDVSEWQGNVDFSKVKKAGIDYVILRAGFGREATQIDSEFLENYKKAKAAGLKVGAYWYSYATDTADAVKEAKACLQVIKGKSFELPVFYDMEDSTQTSLGKATLTKMARAFLEEIKKAGFSAGIYANANWFSNYLDFDGLYKDYYVWLAQYNDVAEFKCDIWQYTSSGKVNGVSGNVDMNIIYGDRILKMVDTPAKVTESYETAFLQALLMISERLGIISQTISPLDNKKGKMTKAAILQMKKAVNMEADETLSLTFARKLYQEILDNLPVVGDVNSDGKVNIKDATALQKNLAGVKDV
ncbi:MAG: hypothetical protein IJF19_02735 [Clostridia bacterium]|nr:hypothetical protein [Clostridia bacterium]